MKRSTCSISPYLLRPLRSYEEAWRDRVAQGTAPASENADAFTAGGTDAAGTDAPSETPAGGAAGPKPPPSGGSE